MFLSQQVGFARNGVEPRKISQANLENLFSIILNIVNLSSAEYRSELVGVAGLIFNKVQIGFMADPLALIANLKLCRAWYIGIARGKPCTNIGFKHVDWNPEQGCPVMLEGLLPVYNKWVEDLDIGQMALFHRVIFALLSMDRVIVMPAKADFSTIEAEYTGARADGKGSEVLIKSEEIESALHSLGINKESFKEVYEREVSLFRYEVITSSGPNGPATWTAYSDVRAWSKEPELLKQLVVYLQESDMVFMHTDMNGTLRLDESDVAPHRYPYLGKHNVIEEWGGKARIVAALDYWSQMALTPLHNTINTFLKRLGSDGTFDQTKIIRRVKEWTKDETIAVNCYDLTAATDRIPISLQKEIITKAMGSASFATAWSRILSEREFIDDAGTLRRYKVGQPMGARSSFPMLALTHHVIIQIAASRAKCSKYTEYGVIGDDSALTQASVSENYKAIMAAYGIKINPTKSIEASGSLLSAAEICKRVFISGVEISSIPVKTICKTIRDGKLATQLQNELTNRDLGLGPTEFWMLMSTILDNESLQLHLKQNLMPEEIVGLSEVIAPEGLKNALPSTWFDGVDLKRDDIIEVYTWTVATESLKRLDSLLRSSLSIANLIELKAQSGNPDFKDTLLGEISTEVATQSEADAPDAAAALKTLPRLNSFHPITQASQYEARRLADDLFLLASADQTMVNRARGGLLDRFRNALTDLWEGRARISPQQDRSLLLKALKNLETICVVREDYTLDYTVVLALVGRMWSVRLNLGSRVLINSVRSRITTSMVQAGIKLDSAMKQVTFRSGTAKLNVVQGSSKVGPSLTTRARKTANKGVS